MDCVHHSLCKWFAFAVYFYCELLPAFAKASAGDGGDKGVRTPDPRLAKPMLYQLSYIPDFFRSKLWAWVDLNHRPHPYQGCALAT